MYVAVEGIDGSGKTVFSRRLVSELRRRGIRCVLVEEPSDGLLGRAARLLLETGERDCKVYTLVFAADRLKVHDRIMEYLRNGYVVVSSRSMLSSLAYQSAMGCDTGWILEVNRYALLPDIVVYLDVDPREAIKRIVDRPRRVFIENEEFLGRARRMYEHALRFARENGAIVLVNPSIRDVVEAVEKGTRNRQVTP